MVEEKKKRFRLFRKKKTGDKPENEPAQASDEVVSPAPKVVQVQVPKETAVQEKPSWLARSKRFQKMSDWAFDVVDTDGSGSVDEKELYSGLLLIHLKLGTYAGPAACKPVGRERVSEIFKNRDLDHSGSLDKREFREVMAVLCGNVFTRVFVQWSLTLMIVPLVAQYLLSGLSWLFSTIFDFITGLDDYEAIEAVFIARGNQFSGWLCEKLPPFLVTGASIVATKTTQVLDMIPDSVLESVPVTLVSCILSCLVVPYTIFQIDDFFQGMAERREDKVDTEKKTK